jgi:integrase/recombinase XerD
MNEEVLEKYLIQMSNSGKSETTVKTAKSIMKNFFIWYGEKSSKQITADDIEKYINYLMTTKFDQHNPKKEKKKLEESSVFQKKYVLRQFLKWLHKIYPEVPDLSTQIELKKMKRKELPDRLTDEEIRMMIEKSHLPRDKAMIAFLAESGCRRGELLGIKIKYPLQIVW